MVLPRIKQELKHLEADAPRLPKLKVNSKANAEIKASDVRAPSRFWHLAGDKKSNGSFYS